MDVAHPAKLLKHVGDEHQAAHPVLCERQRRDRQSAGGRAQAGGVRRGPFTIRVHRPLATMYHVKIVVTKAGAFFLEKVKDYNPLVWSEFVAKTRAYGEPTREGGDAIEIIRDEHEWDAWKVVGDKVLHIELKDWADVILMAPMSANTMAKIANGLSDNLLTCIARAWSVKKPFFYAPAMNTDMWDHPVTAKHVKVLAEFGYHMIPPVEKMLACGVVGVGGLAAVDDIVQLMKEKLQHTSQ